MKLLKCDTCDKIYKVINQETVGDIGIFYTDFGDKIPFICDKMQCIHCNTIVPYEIMEVEDWVADLVFKVRGN